MAVSIKLCHRAGWQMQGNAIVGQVGHVGPTYSVRTKKKHMRPGLCDGRWSNGSVLVSYTI
jgi:hypothetical protein